MYVKHFILLSRTRAYPCSGQRRPGPRERFETRLQIVFVRVALRTCESECESEAEPTQVADPTQSSTWTFPTKPSELKRPPNGPKPPTRAPLMRLFLAPQQGISASGNMNSTTRQNPFARPISGAPAKPRGLEWLISSAPVNPNELERPNRSPQGGALASSYQFEDCSVADQIEWAERPRKLCRT